MKYVENLNICGTDIKEIPCTRGYGVPTGETMGKVGVLYMNVHTGEVYKCTEMKYGVTTWEPLVDSGLSSRIDSLEQESTESKDTIEALITNKEETSNKVVTFRLTDTDNDVDYPSVGAVIQGINDAISTKEDVTNKVTQFMGNETDDQYPSAKVVVDHIVFLGTRMNEKENKANKITAFTEDTTIDKYYPSAKAVADYVNNYITGLQQQINEESHFKGYLSTNAKIQALEATPNDFAYSAESGTKWLYDEEYGWLDTGISVPDQLTPASDTTPLINGEASVGSENAYARGDHRHPTDTTRLGVAEFNEFKSELGGEINSYFDVELSSNLLNMNTLTRNKYISNGSLYDSTTYSTTDFIPCSPGDTLRLQANLGTNRYDSGNTTYDIRFEFISVFDSDKKFITQPTRGKKTYTVPDGAAYVRITMMNALLGFENTYSKPAIIISDDPTVIAYEEYGSIVSKTLKHEFLPQNDTPASKLVAFLPDEICCAVGRTIEIYNNQICPVANKYHIKWDCQIGKALKRKFSIKGTESLVGDYPLTLTIYDDDFNVMFAKTSTLKIVAALTTSKSICPIGDSLTNGKYWLNEVRTLSSNGISFVGTRGNTTGLKHEGRSGFTSTSYLKATEYSFENEGVHPFWDGTNSKFSWEYYKSTTGISPDAVQIFLGTNDFAGTITADSFASNVKQMVDSIRENDTTIPIFIVFTLCYGNQNGLGVQQSSDGFASQKGKFKYDMDCKIINGANEVYDTLKSYTGVYFIPITQCHDSEYNFGAVETPVNPRATQTELMPTEAVHPQQQGYEQMADIIFSSISAHINN